MTAAGETVRDLIIVRDDVNDAVTGLVAGDFAALEAYRIAPTVTAVVTLTEIGGGEYAVSFVPSVAGTWAFHALYTDVGVFAETVRTYDIGTIATTAAVETGDPYLSVAEFKARTRSAVTANDDAIAAVLLSASRSVDGFCGRTFGQVEESRVFDCFTGGWGRSLHFTDEWSPSYGRPCLEVGDVVSVSSIASGDGSGAYPTVWDANSYALLPRNAAAKGFPYTEIGPPAGRWSGWPITAYGVQISGIFGWPAVPAPVKEATFLIANRQKSLFDAPFGMSGGGEMGSLEMTHSLSPLIAQMLNPYVVRTV